ncbi:calcium-responsive transactivator-like isoform X4 [Myxocyprinus asiaticus]|uniref:calcium-responsive transactivator-like isoform X4 n=1 Tax=Myxocyprinus asiaticus TaxID=70543 RepID=UPI0022220914|nr:calcium-responsive transactivator-like isoform X4 [Myxocyprinus asiaticus]
MSVTFSSARPRGKGEVTQQTIQKMLDENHHLIQCIMDYQSKGKTAECTQYQQILHRNLVYLATIADSNQNMQSLLPAPPNPNINIGPSGLGQGAGSQSLHSQTNMNDSMGSGLPPTSLMQSQISNGPSHAPMLQQPTTSMSLPASSHGAGPGYSHSQGTPLQGQGGYSSSASRANLNMQSSQVSMMHQQGSGPHYSSSSGGAQHYQGQQTVGMMGQGNQGGGMMPQRPMGSYRAPQQGHGEYSYQQSSYGEQGYERSFDESSQHYYEGGESNKGNSQYSQQQSQYQQGSGQHQPFSQQQYPSQAGYSAQPQGYGPGQTTSSQYSQYQQGQGQQYTSYRSSSQPGPAAQSQRSYTFEQGQYGNYQQ